MARRHQHPADSDGTPHPKGATASRIAAQWRGNWGPGLALFILTFLVFFPALSGGFIWDDDMHLTEHPCIVGPLGFADIWTSEQARICPLVTSTFWLEYRLWGMNPMPYHLVNILMHAAGAIVLWRVLRILKVPGAWLGAALWAIHPVQVESVAWITELKNTQSGLFFVLTILFFCKWRLVRASGPQEPGTRRHYALAIVFAAMALASKSSTVVLPIVLWLCAWWIERCWRVRRNLIELAPFFVLSIAAGLLTLWTQKVEGGFDPEFSRAFVERLASAGKVFWFYAGKLAWPDPLIFIYPRWQIEPSEFAAWLPAIAAAFVLLLWLWRNHWARGPFFAVAYFVVALGPVLGLVEAWFWRYSFVGDHFQYLASMGPLSLAAAGISIATGRVGARLRWAAQAAVSLLLVVLGVISWRQCSIYRSDEILWTTTVRLNPESWIAQNNLAVLLSRQPGAEAEAIRHFEESLRIRPRNALGHYNLAKLLAQIPGRQADAIRHFEESLQLDPNHGWAHLNFGALLATTPGRQPEALSHYEEALRLMPDSAEAHYNLAVELAKIPGRKSDAIDHYREALGLRPEFPEAHLNLAMEFARRSGLDGDAVVHFEAALRLRPDWAAAHTNYAIFLSGLPDRLPEAIARFEEAVRLQPEVPRAHFNLAGAYYRAERPADAIRHLERAIELDPAFDEARRALTFIRNQIGN